MCRCPKCICSKTQMIRGRMYKCIRCGHEWEMKTRVRKDVGVLGEKGVSDCGVDREEIGEVVT